MSPMTKSQLRTCVTFQSAAFNTTEEAEEFINPGNSGKDVAVWLMQDLKGRGVSVDPEIGQEDFGWYFGFVRDKTKYNFPISYRPGDDTDEPGDWIEPRAAEVIHDVLTRCTDIRNVRWHHSKDIDTHREDMSAPSPLG